MAKGRIVRLVRGKGFGMIRPDDDSATVHFSLSDVRELPEGGLTEGLEVEYEVEQTPKYPHARQLRVVGPAAAHEQAPPSGEATAAPSPERVPEARPRRRDTGRPYRFLNPYNFVRYLTTPRPQKHIMGDSVPPPHDRYVGLTGRITCQITAITPIFVSDGHEIQLDAQHPEHKLYRFFQVNGRDVVPASSLRGELRSIFEAVTNSCFPIMGEERLSYRLEATRAATLVPARVEKAADGNWNLRLFPGLTPINPGQRPRALYAATIHMYDPIEGKRSKVPKIALDGLEHGEPCYALVEKRGIFTYVLQLAKNRQDIRKAANPAQHIVEGWLCINNQNVENKRKERFFFRARENTAGPTVLALEEPICQKYQDLIADYQERHRKEVQERQDSHQPLDHPIPGKGPGDKTSPALSRYMYNPDDLELRDGTLVYAALSNAPHRVQYIAPAAVPRVSYNRRVAELLPANLGLHPCENYEELCPACRVFGWVHGARREKPPTPNGQPIAYAGRVRLSHARLMHDKGVMPDVTLAILSSPKSTTTRFYLMPKDGQVRDGLSDADAGYDGDNILRGRKFYRHHGHADALEYERAIAEFFDGRDDQNRTVRGVRQPGNTFEFTVEFSNLAPVELGALLWSLKLREGGRQCYHRLGFAKPLGFGSAQIQVTQLRILQPGKRYTALEASGGWRDAVSEQEAWIGQFRQAMEQVYGQPFDQLPNVHDLLALLGEPPDLPIHYPRSQREPTAEGKNFEWFVGNKRSGRDAGPRLSLPLAGEEEEGLPLLDKYGRKV